jgi:hypothetical protein
VRSLIGHGDALAQAIHNAERQGEPGGDSPEYAYVAGVAQPDPSHEAEEFPRLPARFLAASRSDPTKPQRFQLIKPISAHGAVFEACSGSPVGDRAQSQNLFPDRVAQRIHRRAAVAGGAGCGSSVFTHARRRLRPVAEDSAGGGWAGPHGKDSEGIPSGRHALSWLLRCLHVPVRSDSIWRHNIRNFVPTTSTRLQGLRLLKTFHLKVERPESSKAGKIPFIGSYDGNAETTGTHCNESIIGQASLSNPLVPEFRS